MNRESSPGDGSGLGQPLYRLSVKDRTNVARQIQLVDRNAYSSFTPNTPAGLSHLPPATRRPLSHLPTVTTRPVTPDHRANGSIIEEHRKCY
jgi:hypothetical protein